MILTELIYVALIPVAVAATCAFVAPRVRLKPPLTWAVSVALAYIAGHLGLASRTGDAIALLIRPREAADWLPHAVLVALGITAITTLAPRPWNRCGIALAITLSIGLPLRLLAGSTYDLDWTLLEKSAHIALLAATLGLTWAMLAAAEDNDHPQLRPVLLIVVASGTAVVVTLSGVFVYGELCVVVAAALTGTLLASKTPRVAGAAGVITCSLGSLVLLSCLYAELTATNAALLFTALILAAGPMPAFMSSRPAWRKTSLRLVVTLLPLVVALA
jgi:hypothetical protein